MSAKEKKRLAKLAALEEAVKEHQPAKPNKISLEDLEKRAKRFADHMGPSAQASAASTPVSAGRAFVREQSADASGSEEMDFSNLVIVGTSTRLEKPYLRLTQIPDPSSVRPLHVLEEAFDFVLKKYHAQRNELEYVWINGQLKAIRQDLLIQHIRNSFSLHVYETHCRLALEHREMGEFNQCLAQVLSHYNVDQIRGANKEEFVAYRILYCVLFWAQLESEYFILYRKLTAEEKSHPLISHALQVRTYFSERNFVRLRELHDSANPMARIMIDLVLEKTRLLYIKVITKAFRPDIPTQYLCDTLCFQSMSACIKFCLDKGIAFVTPAPPSTHAKQGKSKHNTPDPSRIHGNEPEYADIDTKTTFTVLTA